MSLNRTKIQQLSQELLLSITSFLDLNESIMLLSSSKAFYRKLKDPKFLELLMTQIQNLHLYNIKPLKGEIISFFNIIYKHLYSFQHRPSQILDWMPLDASSTNRSESIYCTLSGSQGLWSSFGSLSEDQEQWLLYDLRQDFTSCFIKDITIKFSHFDYVYVDKQAIESPVFPSKYVQVELSFLPDQPIFQSDLIPVQEEVHMGEDLEVVVNISPLIVFARYVKVKFIGMRNRQILKDNLFYLCVDKVVPRGAYCDKIPSQILKKTLYNGYCSEETQRYYRRSIREGLYVEDVEKFNRNLLREIEEMSIQENKEDLKEIFEKNPQLKLDKEFLRYLSERVDVAELYLETLSKKQIHLNFLETILMLNLSIDWGKMDPYVHFSFLKTDKYFDMFYLFHFDPSKLKKYITDIFQKGEREAYRNIEGCKKQGILEFHDAGELKKYVMEEGLRQFFGNGSSNE